MMSFLCCILSNYTKIKKIFMVSSADLKYTETNC